MRVLVGPAHWGGTSHKSQLVEICKALAQRGHEVHYVTNRPAPAGALPAGLVCHEAEVSWPQDLDLDLGVRWLSEPAAQLRVELATAAIEAARAFLTSSLVAALSQLAFDYAVVDAGSLAGALRIEPNRVAARCL